MTECFIINCSPELTTPFTGPADLGSWTFMWDSPRGALYINWLRAAAPKGERFKTAEVCWRFADDLSWRTEVLPVIYDGNSWRVQLAEGIWIEHTEPTND